MKRTARVASVRSHRQLKSATLLGMVLLRAGALIVAGTLLVITPAHAARKKAPKAAANAPPSSSELVRKGKASYDDYEFDKAAAYFADALRVGVAVKSVLEQLHLYYAFSLFALEKKDEAKAQLRALFAASPEFSLTEKGLHPDLVALFDQERAAAQPKVEVKPEPTPEPKVEPKAEPKPEPKAIVVAPEPEPPAPNVVVETIAPPAYQSAHPVVKLIPGGVGQFANGDPLGGGLFLSVELALVGVHVAFAVLDELSRAAIAPRLAAGENIPANEQLTMNLYYGLRMAAGLSAAAVAIIGIIDAFVGSPARGEARHKLRYTVTPTPLPSGGGVTASVAW